MGDRGRRAFPCSSETLARKWYKQDYETHRKHLEEQKGRVDNTSPLALKMTHVRPHNAKAQYLSSLKEEAKAKENIRLLNAIARIMYKDPKFSKAPHGGSNLETPLFRTSLGAGFTSKPGIRLDECQVPFIDHQHPHITAHVAAMAQKVESYLEHRQRNRPQNSTRHGNWEAVTPDTQSVMDEEGTSTAARRLELDDETYSSHEGGEEDDKESSVFDTSECGVDMSGGAGVAHGESRVNHKQEQSALQTALDSEVEHLRHLGSKELFSIFKMARKQSPVGHEADEAASCSSPTFPFSIPHSLSQARPRSFSALPHTRPSLEASSQAPSRLRLIHSARGPHVRTPTAASSSHSLRIPGRQEQAMARLAQGASSAGPPLQPRSSDPLTPACSSAATWSRPSSGGGSARDQLRSLMEQAAGRPDTPGSAQSSRLGSMTFAGRPASSRL